uniref:Uncharacterized protein n=1 Tax=Arion vulgaris TaxID=1028688 RepID=A0A0B6ZT06_9EUPU
MLIQTRFPNFSSIVTVCIQMCAINNKLRVTANLRQIKGHDSELTSTVSSTFQYGT